MSDEQNSLHQRLRRARIARRVSSIVCLLPLLLWVGAFAFVLASQQHPDDGFRVLAVIYYGPFSSLLLIVPAIAFFIFRQRVHTLERRLMFSSTPLLQ